jgi:hypothetical protein
MEDKIKEIIKEWDIDGGETLFQLGMKIAKYSSHLTAERAKSQIGEHLFAGMNIPELSDFNKGLETGLQAIEESKLKSKEE